MQFPFKIIESRISRRNEFDVKDGVIAQFEGQGLMASNGQRGNLIFSICYND